MKSISVAWRSDSASTAAIVSPIFEAVEVLRCMFVSIIRVKPATAGTAAEKAAWAR